MTTQSASRNWRILSLITGLLLFAWLPFEDTSLHWVLLFAPVLSSLAAVRLRIAQYSENRKPSLFVYALIGGLAGLLVSPTALLLMALKSGLHGHLAPDFTIQQIQVVLNLIPVWVLAGLLIGSGLSLLFFLRK